MLKSIQSVLQLSSFTAMNEWKNKQAVRFTQLHTFYASITDITNPTVKQPIGN